MFYCFEIKWLKRAASILLCFSALILFCRFYVIPRHFFPRVYVEYVSKYAQEYQIDETLVYAVMKAESSFEHDAVSHRNAKGLMQITDMTGVWGAEEIGITPFETEDLLNPQVNIQIGCWYLEKLEKQYDGYVETALAAYNAGSGNVSKWLQEEKYSSDGKQLHSIPFPETEKYVSKVMLYKKIYDYLYR